MEMKQPQDAGSNNESERGELKDGENANKKEGSQHKKEKAIAANDDEEEEEEEEEDASIDCFLASVLSLKDDDQNQNLHPPKLPVSVIDKLLSAVETDLSKYEIDTGKCPLPLLDSIDRVAKLSTALSAFSPLEADYKNTGARAGAVLQRAMSFLEEEFRLLLEDNKIKKAPVFRSSSKQTPRRQSSVDSPKITLLPAPTTTNADGIAAAAGDPYPPETVGKLRRIADIMISAGYVSECFQTFSIARHNALDASLSNLGFRRVNNDEMQKMQWEALQREIKTWIGAFRQSITVYFPRERDLCESVFSDHRGIAGSLFNNLTRCVLIQLLNFAEAISVTKGSAEKLFKFLDMYETLRDMLPKMDDLFPSSEEAVDLKSEISSTRSHLGGTAAAIFCDLEGSIRADVAKSPVPGGAVHPLTRYVMNYLKYACEYGNTLEEVFAERQKHASSSSSAREALATQLIGAMDLLDSNLEAKSKMYKETALNYIFLMNNGRYIVKKIKESSDIFALVGENWYRKRSSGLRQYHKNYQRETWAKVLACFKEEGLQVKGNLSRSMLKERMKSFNGMFEEILKTQSTWVVSDEQLKSELRVSISAVLVPAYRSFLGRYRMAVSGKQSEKHVKFGPEDIETKIDELFEGNPSNHGKKR